MYVKGDLCFTSQKPCVIEDDRCVTHDEWHSADEPCTRGVPYSDARDNFSRPREILCAWLPHSCDEWIVGGVEEIDALVADLLAAKAKLT